MTQAVRKYEFIDALRGYAILGVVLVHSSQHVAPVNSALNNVMSNGRRGVQLFFIASALTLCLSWFARNVREISPIRNYFFRRFFRIAPLFYIGIIFYTALYGFDPRYWAPNGIEWWHVLLTGMFLHWFHPETITSVVPGGWSIAVEMSFYLILPLLLANVRTINGYLVALAFSIVLYVIAKIAAQTLLQEYYPYDQRYLLSMFTNLNIFGQFPVFVIGILCYFIFSNRGLLRKSVLLGNLTFLSLIALILMAPTATLITKVFSNHIAASLVLALFALTIACYPVKLLVNPVIGLIGKVSFSMYILHFAVLEFMSRIGVSASFGTGDIASISHFLCVLVITVPLSYVLYQLVEKPGMLAGKYLIDRLEDRVVAGPLSGIDPSAK